jgi:hypothetical protein
MEVRWVVDVQERAQRAGVKGEVHQRGLSKFPKQPIAAVEKGECLD